VCVYNRDHMFACVKVREGKPIHVIIYIYLMREYMFNARGSMYANVCCVCACVCVWWPEYDNVDLWCACACLQVFACVHVYLCVWACVYVCMCVCGCVHECERIEG